MEARVEGLIEQLHQITDKSVAVGFGVSGPEQVCLILQSAGLSTTMLSRNVPLTRTWYGI